MFLRTTLLLSFGHFFTSDKSLIDRLFSSFNLELRDFNCLLDKHNAMRAYQLFLTYFVLGHSKISSCYFIDGVFTSPIKFFTTSELQSICSNLNIFFPTSYVKTTPEYFDLANLFIVIHCDSFELVTVSVIASPSSRFRSIYGSPSVPVDTYELIPVLHFNCSYGNNRFQFFDRPFPYSLSHLRSLEFPNVSIPFLTSFDSYSTSYFSNFNSKPLCCSFLPVNRKDYF